MHDEAVGTLQAHDVALHGIEIVVARIELAGPTRKAVEELEHCIVGDGIPEMITVYESVQTIHDDVEEWVQRGKSRVLFATHYPSPMRECFILLARVLKDQQQERAKLESPTRRGREVPSLARRRRRRWDREDSPGIQSAQVSGWRRYPRRVP